MLKNGTRRYERWWNALIKRQARFLKFLRKVLIRRGYDVQNTIFLGQEVGFNQRRQRLEPRHLEAAAYEYGEILCRCCGKDIITLENLPFEIVDQMIPNLAYWRRDNILIVANPNMKYGQIDTVKSILNVGRITKFKKPKPRKSKATRIKSVLSEAELEANFNNRLEACVPISTLEDDAGEVIRERLDNSLERPSAPPVYSPTAGYHWDDIAVNRATNRAREARSMSSQQMREIIQTMGTVEVDDVGDIDDN